MPTTTATIIQYPDPWTPNHIPNTAGKCSSQVVTRFCARYRSYSGSDSFLCVFSFESTDVDSPSSRATSTTPAIPCAPTAAAAAAPSTTTSTTTSSSTAPSPATAPTPLN
ncbi:uncharacterized protein An12g00150 [Aspergillus niger]|uniref:Contig An12c0010, genomic contig n=2 Tax=Aspergillus niger TaxID=5061 RepID=A2QY65_ASPNC|nr:uncharacterized protein An12g00150 [Aspergillus niger]CAK40945.1 unnamed protein product [Aspergillus niger]